jgi:hypothetical protein
MSQVYRVSPVIHADHQRNEGPEERAAPGAGTDFMKHHFSCKDIRKFYILPMYRILFRGKLTSAEFSIKIFGELFFSVRIMQKIYIYPPFSW